jgi:hypothetical protein
VKRFSHAAIDVFGPEYLRAPNEEDTERLLAESEAQGWPGMLGSIYNCPAAWKGQYKGHCKDATIILEAVASNDLWIWHLFFGLPGSLNDFNVLSRSPLFSRLIQGEAPPCNYEVNPATSCQQPHEITFRNNARGTKERCGESLRRASEALCHCSWTSRVLETANPMADNDMLLHFA